MIGLNTRLRNKTVLITGASGGLGERIARQCAENGANLILLARNFENLKKLKEELANYSSSIKIEIYQADVGDTAELKNIYEEMKLKDITIDVLVNNAGFGMFKTVLETSLEETKNMFQVNVLGLITMTKLVLPDMIQQGSGHIINIASQAGKISTPKSAVYSATKKAVLGFSDSLRMEVKNSDIYITTVNPGPIATNFFHIADESGDYLKNVERWVLKPDDVARKVVDKMFTNTREINLPKLMNAGSKMYMIFPGLVEFLGKKAFFSK